jgi:hypothetical protein
MYKKYEYMKKALLLIFMAGILDIGITKAANPDPQSNPDKENTNKLTHNKLLKKLGHGVSHGYYVVTHNKLTKALTINDGNQKYKNRDDV